MGTIKKITAVKRRALCPRCFSVIEWDNATFERYDSENDSYYIICPAELNDSNCGQKITINKINPDDYLDNDIVFEPVEGGTVISIDSEDVNFNNFNSGLNATNVNQAIKELKNNINGLNSSNINYNNTQSELEATNIQNAIDELNNNIKTVNEKEIQAESIVYNNIDSDLESIDTQNAITELNEKINQINIDNSVTVTLIESKIIHDDTFLMFSGLNYIVNMLKDISLENKYISDYKISLNVNYPTFTKKYSCLLTYQNDSNEILNIIVNNNVIISATSTNITWNTADSRTITIPINSITSDGNYTYTIPQQGSQT